MFFFFDSVLGAKFKYIALVIKGYWMLILLAFLSLFLSSFALVR